MTLVLGDGLLVLFRDVKELTLRKCNHISILYITLHNIFKYFEKHQDKLCVRFNIYIMAPQLSIMDKSDVNVCLKHFLHCA